MVKTEELQFDVLGWCPRLWFFFEFFTIPILLERTEKQAMPKQFDWIRFLLGASKDEGRLCVLLDYYVQHAEFFKGQKVFCP